MPLDDASRQLPSHPVEGAATHVVLEPRDRRLRRQARARHRVPPEQQLVDGVVGEELAPGRELGERAARLRVRAQSP